MRNMKEIIEIISKQIELLNQKTDMMQEEINLLCNLMLKNR